MPTQKMKKQSLYSTEDLCMKIRDEIYKTQKPMKEIFNSRCNSEEILDEESFVSLVKKYCSSVSEDEARLVFETVTKVVDSKVITYANFKKLFSTSKPSENFREKGVQQVKLWMHKNSITPDQAFDSLAGSRVRLTLEQFEEAILSIKALKFTTPETEILFNEIDENKDGYIDRHEWGETFEDTNTLQLVREIVKEQNLSSDDLLFKMNIRIWDEDLDFYKFAKAMRKLDPTLTDLQLKSIAKNLKRPDNNLIEVPFLVKNLCGKDYETVHFRDKMHK
jgi:Ca2+-binding EF-hand superfamily protein